VGVVTATVALDSPSATGDPVAVDRLERWTGRLRAVWLVLLAVLLVDAAVSGRWAWVAGVVVLLLLLALSSLHGRRGAAERAQESSAAAERWTPELVDEVVRAAGERHVAAVKALRGADPSLSMLDADRLVRGRTRD